MPQRGTRPRQPVTVRRVDWKLRFQLIAVAGVAAAAILAILAIAPVTHPYSQEFGSGYPTPGLSTLSVPKGADVSGSWTAPGAYNVTFGVLDSGGTPIYVSTAHGGTFGFTANDPPYTFTALSYATVSVYVWGNYSAPLL